MPTFALSGFYFGLNLRRPHTNRVLHPSITLTTLSRSRYGGPRVCSTIGASGLRSTFGRFSMRRTSLFGMGRGGAHALESGGKASNPSDSSPLERVPHSIDPAKKKQDNHLYHHARASASQLSCRSLNQDLPSVLDVDSLPEESHLGVRDSEGML